jgi:hypothetical protein
MDRSCPRLTAGYRPSAAPARPHDPLLAKPVRAGSSPGEAVNGAGHGRCGVVRGCPLATGQDSCEWHACGTAGSTRMASGCRRRLQMSRRRGPPWMTDCLVGKPRRRPGRRVRICVALAAGCGATRPRWSSLWLAYSLSCLSCSACSQHVPGKLQQRRFFWDQNVFEH